MKRICKIFAVLLVMAIALFSFSITAGATEVSNTQDGLVASITSEKDSYKSNEDIELTFKVTNTNDFAVENVSLEAIIPDGLTLKNNDDTNVNIVSLGSGESLELTLTAVKESSVITVPIGDSTETPTQTQPVATETAENTTVVQTDCIQATTTKVNSATSDTVSTNGTDNTTIQTGKTISYLLIGLICLVCLAVAFISFRFRKKTVKYLSLVLCVCIAVSSVAFVGITNTMAQETTQQMSFEVSKTITVDSEKIQLKLITVYEVTLNEDDKEKIVSESILNLSKSDDFDNLSDNEKVDKYKKLLNEYANKGFVKRSSISYDNGILGFECSNGREFLIEIVSHSRKHEQEAELFKKFHSSSSESSAYTENTARYAITSASVGSIQSKLNAVIMYDWFNYGEKEDFDNYYNHGLPDELRNNGINTSLFIHPTVQDYKTAFANKEIIDIAVHGVIHENKSYLYTKEKVTDNKNGIYKDDLNKKLIAEILCTDDNTYYYGLSYKFFEYYYKDSTELNNSIVFLESCYGFGVNGKTNFTYADSFIKAGAETVIGYNHTSIITHADSITETAILELVKGNTIGASIATAKEQWGSDSGIYCEKLGFELPEIPVSPIIRGNTEKKIVNEPIAGQISGMVYEENRKEAINDVRIKVYDSNNKIVNVAITGRYGLDNEGHFIINALSEGDYKFVFSKDGYNEKTSDVQVKNGDDQVLVITMEKDNGSLSASVISSDNTPLPDVRVDAYLKAESGIQYVGNTYTDDKGNFSMALQGGSYELRFNKDGYKTATTTIKISKDVLTVLKDPVVMEKENNKYVSVSLGSEHSAAITENGDLYMWGSNGNGQLGDGTTIDKKTPTKIMSNVKLVSLGRLHTAAITNNGDLYMWGENGDGQLGNGTTTSSNIPIKIMSNVKSVSLGWYYYSAAITENGDLYTWGFNGSGQLGDGTTYKRYNPTKIMSNVKSVSLGSDHSAAITENDDLYTWGNNGYGKLGDGTTYKRHAPTKIMSNIKSVELGKYHSAAITNNGDLYMWGDNGFGQLGTGETGYKSIPTKIMSNVKTVSLGFQHSASITENGELYTWGKNWSGELGNGTVDGSNIPQKIMNKISLVSLGDYYSAAITENGDLYLWGANTYGQLGNGTTNSSTTPIKLQ